MKTICFSHHYTKMPVGVETDTIKTKLIGVFETDAKDLSSDFIKYDTAYRNPKTKEIEHYSLPKGKVMILLLMSSGELWTTIRSSWPPRKVQYYKDLVGQQIKIEVKKDA